MKYMQVNAFFLSSVFFLVFGLPQMGDTIRLSCETYTWMNFTYIVSCVFNSYRKEVPHRTGKEYANYFLFLFSILNEIS